MSLFETFFPQKVPGMSGMAALGGKTFESLLHNLRSQDSPLNFVKSAVLKDSLNLLWDLVGNRVVPVAATNAVASMHFMAEGKSADFSDSRAFILLPETYLMMVTTDSPMQVGAMAFIASKAKDYWNHRLDGKTEKRAFSMEAQILLDMFEEYPQLEERGYPNEYQKKVLAKYPEGIESALDAHYKTRPFDVKAGPPWPVK
jgi:hypothetical protein